jgi:hypothetical protein
VGGVVIVAHLVPVVRARAHTHTHTHTHTVVLRGVDELGKNGAKITTVPKRMHARAPEHCSPSNSGARARMVAVRLAVTEGEERGSATKRNERTDAHHDTFLSIVAVDVKWLVG